MPHHEPIKDKSKKEIIKDKDGTKKVIEIDRSKSFADRDHGRTHDTPRAKPGPETI